MQAVTIIALDFVNKSCRTLTGSEINSLIPTSDVFFWIDVDYSVENALEQVSALNLLEAETLQDIFEDGPETRLSRHDDFLHLVVSGFEVNSDQEFITRRLDLVLYENFMLTAHHGDHFVIDMIKGEYAVDFERFAKTSSFLLFEFWDALIEHYAETQQHLEIQVEQIQSDLVQIVDDRIFQRFSAIGENLLHFRSVLMPTRTILTELAGRRSHLISQATQSALNNIAATLERVLQDVLVDREILTQSLNLHMSMVGHRTNQAMSKLTVISVIFLPLTFLCGVYGMNFRILPELNWHYGYAFFWLVCIGIVSVLVYLLHRNRLL